MRKLMHDQIVRRASIRFDDIDPGNNDRPAMPSLALQCALALDVQAAAELGAQRRDKMTGMNQNRSHGWEKKRFIPAKHQQSSVPGDQKFHFIGQFQASAAFPVLLLAKFGDPVLQLSAFR